MCRDDRTRSLRVKSNHFCRPEQSSALRGHRFASFRTGFVYCAGAFAKTLATVRPPWSVFPRTDNLSSFSIERFRIVCCATRVWSFHGWPAPRPARRTVGFAFVSFTRDGAVASRYKITRVTRVSVKSKTPLRVFAGEKSNPRNVVRWWWWSVTAARAFTNNRTSLRVEMKIGKSWRYVRQRERVPVS